MTRGRVLRGVALAVIVAAGVAAGVWLGLWLGEQIVRLASAH